MRRFWRSRRFALVGAFVVAAVVGGVAWATIPGDDGVINACVAKNGTVRLIDPALASCRKGEQAIWWNVTGEPGAPGEPGTPGAPGAAYADWNGSGGTNYKPLTNTGYTELLSLQLPAELDAGPVVATATVWITNWLATPVFAGCNVLSDSGGAGWPFTLQHGFNLITFPGSFNAGAGTLHLACTVNPTDFLNNPDPNGRVWAEMAALTVVPRIAE